MRITVTMLKSMTETLNDYCFYKLLWYIIMYFIHDCSSMCYTTLVNKVFFSLNCLEIGLLLHIRKVLASNSETGSFDRDFLLLSSVSPDSMIVSQITALPLRSPV
jgi:hypothetical protein